MGRQQEVRHLDCWPAAPSSQTSMSRLQHFSRLSVLLGWPAGRPWTTLGVTLALSLLALVGAMKMRPSASLGAMMGAEDAAGAALERILTRFDAANQLLVLVSLPPDASDESARERLLGFARRLEAGIHASPAASGMCKRVAWRADPETGRFFTEVLVPSGLYYLDDAEFEAFRQRLTPAEIKAQIARDEAAISAPGAAAGALTKALLQDPLRLREFLTSRLAGARSPLATAPGGDEFISPDGRHLLMRLTGVKPSTDLDFAQSYTSEVRRLADQANTDGLTVDLSGAYAIAAASASSIKSDMLTSDGWSIVFMQILFLIAYRSVFTFLLTILPCAIAILLAFGVYIPFSPHLSPLSAVIGAAVAGQGIDYCIHYMTHFEEDRRRGASPREAAEHTGRHIGPLLLAASGTAIIAFLAVLFSGVRALRDFAALGAIGLVFSLASALIVLPALLVGLERLRGDRPRRHGPRFGFAPVTGLIGRHRRVLIGASSLFLAGGAAVVLYPPQGVGFETDLTVMHPRPNRPLESQAEIGRLFGGAGDSLIVHLQAPDAAGLLALSHEADRRLRSPEATRAGVRGSLGPATLLPDPHALAARADLIRAIDAEKVIADFHAALADSIFEPGAFKGYSDFIRKLLNPGPAPDLKSLRAFPSLASEVLPAAAPEPGQAFDAIALVWFSATLDEAGARARAVTGLRASLAGLTGATPTGLGVIGYDLEQAIKRELPRSLGFAAGAVLIALFIYFRRPVEVALALVPVAFGIISLLAFMRLTGDRFNMANLVAMPLLLGLAVDNGIFLTGLARAAAKEPDPSAALARSFAASGHATFMVSATTILAFGSMVFTSVPAIGSLGRVFAVGTTASLASAYFLLMPLLLERTARMSRGAGLTAAAGPATPAPRAP